MFGGLFAAPLAHLWYTKWAPNLVSKITTNAKLRPVLSMVADQLLYSSAMMTLFLFGSEYFKDFNATKARNNLRDKLWPGLKVNWTVWPPVQLLNFTVIPPQFRVTFVSFVGLFWTIYLSYLQNVK